MRTPLRLVAALVASVIASPSVIGQPPPEVQKSQEQLERSLRELKEKLAQDRDRAEKDRAAEMKRVQEQLELKLRELRDQEVKKLRPDAPKLTQPTPAKPMALILPVQPAQPAADPAATLKPLLSSKDPKVAALAKELLDQLNKKSGPQGGIELQLDLSPSAQAGGFELKLTPPGKPGTRKPEITPDGRVVIVGEKADGAASLKMSADGKTAAVVAADGSVTVFDVASGKELMRFPGKK